MSCCGGNCGCGSNCGCGNGCGGCKMFPDFDEKAQNATVLVSGVAAKISYVEGSEMGVAAEDGGCPCGDNCKCDPCTCK